MWDLIVLREFAWIEKVCPTSRSIGFARTYNLNDSSYELARRAFSEPGTSRETTLERARDKIGYTGINRSFWPAGRSTASQFRSCRKYAGSVLSGNAPGNLYRAGFCLTLLCIDDPL